MTALVLALTLSAGPDGWDEPLADPAGKAWQKVDPKWIHSADVTLDPDKPTRLKPTGGSGPVWVNGDAGRVADLLTVKKYRDSEIHVEFLIGKNSNSGVKFLGLYEIQFRDTAGKTGPLTGDDCGGIYPMAITWAGGYRHIDDGVAPRVNATKPAGQWQTLEASFRAPRFDAAGQKTANAVMVKAVLNGQLIHENVTMKYPTGANWELPEKPDGPFMLQADHGPVAFRNVKVREIK